MWVWVDPPSLQALVQAAGRIWALPTMAMQTSDRCGPHGRIVDGDKILAICGLQLLKAGELPQRKIAATLYSNGGLVAFRDAGACGDNTARRCVLGAMLEHGLRAESGRGHHLPQRQHDWRRYSQCPQTLGRYGQTGQPLAELAEVMPVF